MSIFQAIVLGLVQGFSEFLPISSSGHLEILSFFWSGQDLFFDVMLHMGTLVAVIFYFRKTILEIMKGFFKLDPNLKEQGKLGWLIILGTLPAVFFGFLIQEVLGLDFRNPVIVSVNLIVWGVVLWLADFYMSRQEKEKIKTDLKTVKLKDALFIGFFQILALIPGVSRSGVTITAGLFRKFNRETSANFSFLLSIPIIASSGVLALFEVFKNGNMKANLPPLFFGFLASVVGGFFAIYFLMKIIKKVSYTPFVIYRILLGVVLLIILLF